jgi:hypothetical protein
VRVHAAPLVRLWILGEEAGFGGAHDHPGLEHDNGRCAVATAAPPINPLFPCPPLDEP